MEEIGFSYIPDNFFDSSEDLKLNKEDQVQFKKKLGSGVLHFDKINIGKLAMMKIKKLLVKHILRYLIKLKYLNLYL